MAFLSKRRCALNHETKRLVKASKKGGSLLANGSRLQRRLQDRLQNRHRSRLQRRLQSQLQSRLQRHVRVSFQRSRTKGTSTKNAGTKMALLRLSSGSPIARGGTAIRNPPNARRTATFLHGAGVLQKSGSGNQVSLGGADYAPWWSTLRFGQPRAAVTQIPSQIIQGTQGSGSQPKSTAAHGSCLKAGKPGPSSTRRNANR
mmetsp:Transcript_78195/g.151054  ORF Transcript_78195/g.151054 Transcript_78195/m.151054 type:complete len:202 (+) Transcript_78195:173-778(+)